MPVAEEVDREEDRAEVEMEGGMHKFAKILLETDKIPKEMKKKLPAFFDKETALTFWKDKDLMTFLHMFDDSTTADLMAKAPDEFTFEEERDITQSRAGLFVTGSRSVGGDRRQMNERTALMTQIRQMVQEPVEEPSGGVLNKLKKGISRMAGGR